MTRSSPLEAEHRALGAKMAPFGGWTMPIAYDTGTIAEHVACRTGSAMFDVSHLGTVRLQGADVHERLQRVLTNDLGRIGVGRAQYTHLLNEQGGVEDDIIIWWRDDETFDVMPNASNTAGVIAALGGEDITETRAVIAVQGPSARQTVASVSDGAAEVERFHVRDVTIDGVGCTVAGTGYTGEDGVEIAVPSAAAPGLWRRLLAAGATPAGLGARDTLRLEAALPLHGHELSPTITPLEAGLGWVVSWDKGDFRGRSALAAQKEHGLTRRLRGLVLDGRRPARDGSSVLAGDGRRVGTVTSGNFSPTLGCAIALGLLAADVSVGDGVTIDIRGDSVGATVVATPFVKR